MVAAAECNRAYRDDLRTKPDPKDPEQETEPTIDNWVGGILHEEGRRAGIDLLRALRSMFGDG